MKSIKREFGDLGELAAQEFLINKGFLLRETNYKKPWGEVDIIAMKDNVLVFIEVKTSRYYPESSFTPEIRVNKKKTRSLKRICETYLYEYCYTKNQEWRIDVISVILNQDNSLREISHFENAIFGNP